MIHKLLFPKKHTELLMAKQLLQDREDELYRQMAVSKQRGEHLKDYPFIPEECLFKLVTGHTQLHGYMEVYHRDGFTLAPDFGDLTVKDYPQNMWHVLLPNRTKIYIKIESLFDAILILKALGLDIDYDILNTNDI